MIPVKYMMINHIGLAAVLFLLLFIFNGMEKQQTDTKLPIPEIPYQPKSYIVYKTEEVITLDGNLNEACWNQVDWTEDFVNIEGGKHTALGKRTRVKMLWDDKFLYVGAELEEPHIWATMTRRNSPLYLDNAFEVFIDPDGDTHNYAEFEFNALGTIWDLFITKPYRDGGVILSEWNLLEEDRVGIKIYGTVNNPTDIDQKWSVEIAIELEHILALHGKKQNLSSGDQWKVNFARSDRNLEIKNGKYELVTNPSKGRPYDPLYDTWSPQGLVNMHYPEMWGIVQFSDVLAQEGDVQFKSDPAEETKWVLRKIYYKMHNYRYSNGSYINDIKKLGIDDMYKESKAYQPKIEVTASMFEITLRNQISKEIWHINHEGKIWH